MKSPYIRRSKDTNSPLNSASNKADGKVTVTPGGIAKLGCISMVGIFTLAVGSCTGLSALYNYGTEDTVRFTVDDLERITESDGETVTSKYLIFTEEGETFENTDSLWRWKFDSSDMQGQLDEGKTYDARVYGWRIDWLSSYRNVFEVTEVQTANDEAAQGETPQTSAPAPRP